MGSNNSKNQDRNSNTDKKSVEKAVPKFGKIWNWLVFLSVSLLLWYIMEDMGK